MPIADMPQSNKMHAVPQNIMDVEFKLIGDLTIRQFLYLIIFGGSAYVTSVVLVGVFKWPLVLVFALLGIGLAFVPIQERGLDEWIVNFIKAVYSPTQRIWKHEGFVPAVFMYENLAVVKQELITLAPTSSRRRLEEFLEYHLKDEVLDPLDIPEKAYAQIVRDAYAGYVPPQSAVGVSVLEPEVAEIIAQEVETPAVEEAFPPVAELTPEPVKPPVEEQTAVEPAQTPPVKQDERVAPTTALTPAPTPKVEVKPELEAPQIAQKIVQKPKKHHHTSLTPMTPDMHSGRRFTNLVPKSGELTLPIRGERVVRTTEQIDIDSDINEKAEKLQQLLSQIKQENALPVTQAQQAVAQVIAPQIIAPQVGALQVKQEMSQEAQALAEKLKIEKDRLTGEILSLDAQKQTLTNPNEIREKDSMITRLQAEKERTQYDFEALQKQILDLQTKLKEQEALRPQYGQPRATIVSPTFINPTQFKGPANIVSGEVRIGDMAAKEGTLLIMKNQKGEVVRAFKTNSLGQFKLTTPLSNGIYTVEIVSTDLGVTFDIISVEAKGEPIPPVVLMGR